MFQPDAPQHGPRGAGDPEVPETVSSSRRERFVIASANHSILRHRQKGYLFHGYWSSRETHIPELPSR